MAGAKPGVHVVQLKPISVPEPLTRGSKFIMWNDVSTTLVSLYKHTLCTCDLSLHLFTIHQKRKEKQINSHASHSLDC